MQKTLIEIVQSTLGSMDSDAVNSITDTIEAEQIAVTAEEQFFTLATYQRIPQFEQITQLVGLADANQATVMKIPDDSTDIKNVRYKHTDSNGYTWFKEMQFLEKDDFLDTQLQLRVGDATVGENIFTGNVNVPYRNDRGPTCWTSFDDEYLVFDAIDTLVQVDTTLTAVNSMVIAYIIPAFTLTDGFIPPVPIKLFPQYMDMIKEINSYEQRQISNEVRTRNADRQGNRNRHFASITDGSDEGYSTNKGMGRFSGSGRYNGRGRFR